MWPRMEDDHMEFGESHLIPVDGGYRNTITGEYITEDGRVYDSDGELIYDPDEEEEYSVLGEDYDTFDD